MSKIRDFFTNHENVESYSIEELYADSPSIQRYMRANSDERFDNPILRITDPQTRKSIETYIVLNADKETVLRADVQEEKSKDFPIIVKEIDGCATIENFEQVVADAFSYVYDAMFEEFEV